MVYPRRRTPRTSHGFDPITKLQDFGRDFIYFKRTNTFILVVKYIFL